MEKSRQMSVLVCCHIRLKHENCGKIFPSVSGLLQLLIRRGGEEERGEGNYTEPGLPCDAMQKVEMRALMRFLMVVLDDNICRAGNSNSLISPPYSPVTPACWDCLHCLIK